MTNHVANISLWLPDPVAPDVTSSLQRLSQSDDVIHVAVMPDVHLAGDVCNGVAIATRELLYPRAVGSDIGCGMLAVAFELDADALSSDVAAAQVLAELYRRIPSLKHSRTNAPAELPPDLANGELSTPALNKMKMREGLLQLGSLGRGNHFVEFQVDAHGRLWLMLHSGSRGMGQAIAQHHIGPVTESRTGLGFLEANSEAGQAYLSDVAWAIEYSLQNRLAMARSVESLMKDQFDTSMDWSSLIHCHHNHVQRELHEGIPCWIHRKGALPAGEDEPGVIPGSMGSRSFHVTGRGLPSALCSSSHGAGRSRTRHRARQEISIRDLERQMSGVWFDRRLADGLREEAPAAYKEIGRVMRAQRELTRIERELNPVLVYKGN